MGTASSYDDLLQRVQFGADGLVPVIARDVADGEVLMLAYMNRDTLEQTLRTRLMTYWSRSRGEVWVKGATSGHYQHVLAARVDCDADALLFDVRQDGGAACHTGRRSCFFEEVPLETASAP
jgi:phosphoribosyl-AMP cyclohydrolase